MSKRARGVTKGVHNIAFWVRYALGRTLNLATSKVGCLPHSLALWLNQSMVHWCWAEIVLVHRGPTQNLWVFSAWSPFYWLCCKPFSGPNPVSLLFFVVQVNGFVVSWHPVEVLLVQTGPRHNLWVFSGPSPFYLLCCKPFSGPNPVSLLFFVFQVNGSAVSGHLGEVHLVQVGLTHNLWMFSAWSPF